MAWVVWPGDRKAMSIDFRLSLLPLAALAIGVLGLDPSFSIKYKTQNRADFEASGMAEMHCLRRLNDAHIYNPQECHGKLVRAAL